MVIKLSNFYNIDAFEHYIKYNESVESNKITRDLANKIYQQIANFLTSLLNESQLFNIKIDQYSRDYQNILINTNKIINNCFIIKCNFKPIINDYFDLTINLLPIIHKETSDIAMYNDKDKSINLYVPYTANKGISIGTIKYILQAHNIIIHELVHFIDDIRSNGKYDIVNVSNYDYYNDPAEIHAYTQQLINLISTRIIDSYSYPIDFINSEDKLMGYINNLLEDNDPLIHQLTNKYIISSFKDFFNNLSTKNKQKVLKNISLYFKDKLSSNKTESISTLLENINLIW